MMCVQHQSPGKGPCFPPCILGEPDHLLLSLEPYSQRPVIPICVGHLQRLMTTIIRGLCDNADVELLFDE